MLFAAPAPFLLPPCTRIGPSMPTPSRTCTIRVCIRDPAVEMLLGVDLVKAKNKKQRGPGQLQALQGSSPSTGYPQDSPPWLPSVSLQTLLQLWESCPWLSTERNEALGADPEAASPKSPSAALWTSRASPSLFVPWLTHFRKQC